MIPVTEMVNPERRIIKPRRSFQTPLALGLLGSAHQDALGFLLLSFQAGTPSSQYLPRAS